jgi:hypothetical protein
MTIINRFEGSCDTFGKGKKNPMLLTTLGQIAQNFIYYLLFIFKNKQQPWGEC